MHKLASVQSTTLIYLIMVGTACSGEPTNLNVGYIRVTNYINVPIENVSTRACNRQLSSTEGWGNNRISTALLPGVSQTFTVNLGCHDLRATADALGIPNIPGVEIVFDIVISAGETYDWHAFEMRQIVGQRTR
jgi:hypothetical protein